MGEYLQSNDLLLIFPDRDAVQHAVSVMNQLKSNIKITEYTKVLPTSVHFLDLQLDLVPSNPALYLEFTYIHTVEQSGNEMVVTIHVFRCNRNQLTLLREYKFNWPIHGMIKSNTVSDNAYVYSLSNDPWCYSNSDTEHTTHQATAHGGNI